jgi:hypothetical protein
MLRRIHPGRDHDAVCAGGDGKKCGHRRAFCSGSAADSTPQLYARNRCGPILRLRGQHCLRPLSCGHPGRCDCSELTGVPFRLGSVLRRRRVFHPVGVLAARVIERLAPPGQGLPIESAEIVGRASKGIGLPGRWPNIAGLAWRMPAPSAVTPWDVLAVSAGAGPLTRRLLRPVASWSGASYSTPMPLGYAGSLWWIRARPASGWHRSGLSTRRSDRSDPRGWTALCD